MNDESHVNPLPSFTPEGVAFPGVYLMSERAPWEALGGVCE